MQKKHQIVEQAVEDYAETVHQLSKTSRGLVAHGHPERCVCVCDHELPGLPVCVCVCVLTTSSLDYLCVC